MIRVKEAHLDAKVFEDTAVGFFIWQLFCVDTFLTDYEQDPYEIYDPLFYMSVQGKNRSWPFAYADRWQGRLKRSFQEAVPRFGEKLDDRYRYGLLELGSSFFTCIRGMECRSVFVQMISDERVVYGEGGISLNVHGLEARRRECFLNITTFVQGLAAERIYTNAMLFLEGENVTVPKDSMKAKARALIQEGFCPQLALNFEY